MKHFGHDHSLSCSGDFDKRGKQIGSFDIPLSAHDGAWGVVREPIIMISNGNGQQSNFKAEITVMNMRGP